MGGAEGGAIPRERVGATHRAPQDRVARLTVLVVAARAPRARGRRVLYVHHLRRGGRRGRRVLHVHHLRRGGRRGRLEGEDGPRVAHDGARRAREPVRVHAHAGHPPHDGQEERGREEDQDTRRGPAHEARAVVLAGLAHQAEGAHRADDDDQDQHVEEDDLHPLPREVAEPRPVVGGSPRHGDVARVDEAEHAVRGRREAVPRAVEGVPEERVDVDEDHLGHDSPEEDLREAARPPLAVLLGVVSLALAHAQADLARSEEEEAGDEHRPVREEQHEAVSHAQHHHEGSEEAAHDLARHLGALARDGADGLGHVLPGENGRRARHEAEDRVDELGRHPADDLGDERRDLREEVEDRPREEV